MPSERTKPIAPRGWGALSKRCDAIARGYEREGWLTRYLTVRRHLDKLFTSKRKRYCAICPMSDVKGWA